MQFKANSPSEELKNLPKVELHRHLEGSLRVESMQEIARAHQIDLPEHRDFRPLVQVMPDEPLTFQNFLSKFQVLRLFYVSPEVIRRFVREAVEDAARDNIRYLELTFTPLALARRNDYPLDEVMDWVIETATEADAEFGVKTRFIASANRHESVQMAEKVAQHTVDRLEKGVFGFGLVGNEADFSALPFLGLCRELKQSGVKLSIHAGEWAGAENVKEAIEVFEAERIGHGVRVLEDQMVVDLALERGTAFEVCLSSNIHSGVIDDMQKHPMSRMLDAGLNVTLNTDDPGISNITLSDEYQIALQKLGMTEIQLQERILSAANASFLPEAEKKALLAEIEQAF